MTSLYAKPINDQNRVTANQAAIGYSQITEEK